MEKKRNIQCNHVSIEQDRLELVKKNEREKIKSRKIVRSNCVNIMEKIFALSYNDDVD